MVYCSLCKETKESKNNWVLYENGANGVVKKYRICDDCAITIVKEISSQVLGLREGEDLPVPLQLSNIGVIEGVHLLPNDEIELAIKADFSQAKRIIEKKKEEETLKKMKEEIQP